MLIIFYDSSKADRASYNFIGSINSKIKNTTEIDVNNEKDTSKLFMLDANKRYPVLFVKPFDTSTKKEYLKYIKNYIDIEYQDGITCTAEAILQELLPVKGKKIAIINQSQEVGQSLALALMREKATVISVCSLINKNDLQELLKNTDILITATGDPNFLITKEFTAGIEEIIDLSHDCEDSRAIRHIKTVKVLINRLKKYKYI